MGTTIRVTPWLSIWSERRCVEGCGLLLPCVGRCPIRAQAGAIPAVDCRKRPSRQRLSDSIARHRRVQIGSVLVVIATRLVNLPGLRLIVGAVALIVILLRLLLIDLRVIERAAAARRRVARAGVGAVGRIDVVVILRHVAAGGGGPGETG